MMSSTRSDNLTPDATIDTTPFLSSALYSRSLAQGPSGSTSGNPQRVQSVRTHGLRQAARFLRRASNSRRMLREPSMVVRETAAQQLEERQSDWAYSRPVVWLDVAWNFAFLVVAAIVLVLSRDEVPGLPLRLWVVGYGIQCTVHILCVSIEYRRRSRRFWALSEGGESESMLEAQDHEESSAVTRHLESANTIFSFIWWLIGFYWIFVGGQALQRDSPQLYWLCIVFLAFDVFFVIFCVALASVIAVGVCCCLPCIIAILYILAERGGASKEDIEQLPKYRFQIVSGEEKVDGEEKNSGDTQGIKCGGLMIECGTDSPEERRLPAEDAECCICLSSYEDATELRELPCSHHFHCACVDKWLFINSTCPLCKYDILKRNSLDGEV